MKKPYHPLRSESAILVVVDVQTKLAELMWEKAALYDGLQRLIAGMKAMDAPIMWVEQNPAGLGPTIPEVARLLSHICPIPKFSFSCCGNETFDTMLRTADRLQVILCGIETHVCVYQTALDLISLGKEVHVVTDAVSSRTRENKLIGLEKMRDAGASMTSVETCLFELLKEARGERFKTILKIVK